MECLNQKLYEIECIFNDLRANVIKENQTIESEKDALTNKKLAEQMLIEWCFDKVVELCETFEDIEAELDKAYERLDEVD